MIQLRGCHRVGCVSIRSGGRNHFRRRRSAPSITVSPGTERPAAWAWSCRLDSYFSPDGSSQHLACWQIENTGRTRVRIQMPAGATFYSACIDDTLCTAGTLSAEAAPSAATSVDPAAASGNRAKSGLLRAANNAAIKLELPADRRFVRVVLEWGSGDGPLSILSSRTSQLPEIDMPVMARQWHVWLPPRFRLSNPAAEGQSSLVALVSWSQRLFGPFGKPAGETAFNPLRSDEWVSMVRPFSGHDPAWTQASWIADRLEQRGTSGTPTPGTARSGMRRKRNRGGRRSDGNCPCDPVGRIARRHTVRVCPNTGRLDRCHC